MVCFSYRKLNLPLEAAYTIISYHSWVNAYQIENNDSSTDLVISEIILYAIYMLFNEV